MLSLYTVSQAMQWGIDDFQNGKCSLAPSWLDLASCLSVFTNITSLEKVSTSGRWTGCLSQPLWVGLLSRCSSIMEKWKTECFPVLVSLIGWTGKQTWPGSVCFLYIPFFNSYRFLCLYRYPYPCLTAIFFSCVIGLGDVPSLRNVWFLRKNQ